MTPTFLTLDEVIVIHREIIEQYGGSLGIRDLDLLESAVAMPQAGIGDQYFHPDLFEMAAAYLFHIVQNHPFIDGNKRTGAMAAYTFLKLNRVNLTARESGFERIIRRVSEGKMGKASVTAFLRQNSQRQR
ncbi:MAG: type II toxin-antitoxin system death-on-curing family toxin [Candidatus Binatia bacterium]